MNDISLKRCPFCGGRAKFYNTDMGADFIACVECESSTTLFFSRTAAADAWNKQVGEQKNGKKRNNG